VKWYLAFTMAKEVQILRERPTMLPHTYIACVQSYFRIAPGCNTSPCSENGLSYTSACPLCLLGFTLPWTQQMSGFRIHTPRTVTASLSGKLSLWSICTCIPALSVLVTSLYCFDIIITLFWCCFVCLQNWHDATLCVYFSNSINTCNLILNIMKVVFHLTTVSATCVVTLSWLIAEPRVLSCRVCRMSVRV